ncbi:FecR family protein [Catalinimonas niigatensis]|uniref:FecR family protein n=1 Tax=Catalinimonas niigatensis TaxID=1397264 RepID=UPI002665D455|nr:FecR family protein [Catalinimonas niigatensis]WPP51465.1 FecR family protein [Catalinimonas niigatensis]
MQEDRIWNLIGRQWDGTASTEEEKEIEEWKIATPENAQLYQVIYAYWKERRVPSADNAQHVWNSVKERISQKEQETDKTPFVRKIHLYKRLLPIAASVTLLILAGYFFFSPQVSFPLYPSEIVKETPRSVRTQMVLPDGSKVWLNADSKLTYPKQFGEVSREVSLTGEAFFEVEQNPELPFIIHLENDTRIQVLGTSFNVKAYTTDEVVETAVLTGKVMFVSEKTSVRTDTTYYLTANQKLAFAKTSGTIETTEVNSQEEIAWIEGKMVFKNEKWSSIAHTLERNFNTQVHFENEALKNCRLTATFEDNSLTEILNLISLTQEFDYQKEGNTIIILGKGCPDV